MRPRIVTKWRRRFPAHGLAGLIDLPRASKQPIYGQATNKRIPQLLDKPPPAAYPDGRVCCWCGRWKTLMSNNVWQFLREHKIGSQTPKFPQR